MPISQVCQVRYMLSRKSRHPEEADTVVHAETEDFSVLEGNGILVSKQKDTLAALFTGDCALPKPARESLKKILKEWQESAEGRIPYKGPRKRSYNDGAFVSEMVLLVSFTPSSC